ncbi:IS200/IS605 family transposase [Streptomyces sp. NBC_00045]
MSTRWEPNPNIRTGGTVVYTLHAHLVFTPRYRRGPFTDEILTRCEEVMLAVCADFATELVEFNGERDHVHLLVHYPPKVALSLLVGSLKGVSARGSSPDHAEPSPVFDTASATEEASHGPRNEHPTGA